MEPDWWPECEEKINLIAHDFTEKLEQRLKKLKELKDVEKILRRKNPFLFSIRTKNDPNTFSQMVVDAYLSSSEETMFGNSLEEIAIAVCHLAKNGRKSASDGIDLEYEEDGERTIIQIKSGPNWGNSEQRAKLEEKFKTAVKRLRQSDKKVKVRCIEGICYGTSGEKDKGHHLILTGNVFWEDISGWAGTSKAVIKTLNCHTRNGMSGLKTGAAKSIADILDKEGVIKKNKIQWDKMLDFVM